MNNISKLTICIISYNRGTCALRQVINIKERLGNGISVLVLDNASTSDCDGYKEIEKLSKENEYIKYHRHPLNCEFIGNFIACFELSKTPYIQVMSDEDFPNIAMLHESIQVLEEFQNVAVIRGSIGNEEGKVGRNNLQYPDAFYPAGETALINFFLRTNYISGVIYNRKLVIETDFIDRLKNVSKSHQVYPHMYLDFSCASMFDVILTSSIACWEGPEHPAAIGMQELHGATSGFPGRLDQFLAFRDLITEVHYISKGQKQLSTSIILYELLCNKYFYLIKCDAFIFRKFNIDPDRLNDVLLHFAVAASNIPIFHGYEKLVIDRIYQSYYRTKLISS